MFQKIKFTEDMNIQDKERWGYIRKRRSHYNANIWGITIAVIGIVCVPVSAKTESKQDFDPSSKIQLFLKSNLEFFPQEKYLKTLAQDTELIPLGSPPNPPPPIPSSIPPISNKSDPETIVDCTLEAFPFNVNRTEDPEDNPCNLEHVPTLVHQLQDPDKDVKSFSAYALASIQPITQANLERLVSILQDPEPEVKSMVALALGSLGTTAKVAIPDLIKELENENTELRESVTIALGQIGITTNTVISALLEQLNEEDESIRDHATLSLAELGKKDQSVVSSLTENLQNEHWVIRQKSAEALGLIGPGASTAIPTLINAFRTEVSGSDWPNRNRGDIGWNIGQIGGPGAQQQFISKMRGIEIPLAIQDLGRTGPMCYHADYSQEGPDLVNLVPAYTSFEDPLRTTAIQQLRVASQDKDPHVRSQAVLTFLMFDNPKAHSVIPLLTNALSDQHEEVRRYAEYSLRFIEPKAALSGFVSNLWHQDSNIRWEAVDALRKRGVDATLIDALQDEDKVFRRRAFQELLLEWVPRPYPPPACTGGVATDIISAISRILTRR